MGDVRLARGWKIFQAATGTASRAESEAAEAAGATDQDLEKLIIGVLTDVTRSGAPPRFSAEQIAGIIALACEPPADSGLPVFHWTPSELAREAAQRGIVVSISPRQLDRFFSEADLRPHKSQYWLTSLDKREAPAQYQADVERLCHTYRDALRLSAEGTHVVSVDEKTGMQALERIHPASLFGPVWSNASNSSTTGTVAFV